MRLIDADALLKKECCGRIAGDDVRNAPTIEAAPKWISIKERMPEALIVHDLYAVSATVIIADSCGFRSTGHFVYDRATGSWEFVSDTGKVWDVAHWMPLPDAPVATSTI